MKTILLALLLGLASTAFASTAKPCPPFDVATAAVASEEAAIEYAKQVWKALFVNNPSWRKRFGSDSIESFEPYSAVLSGAFWVVTGTPRNGKLGPTLRICASDRSGSIGGP